MFLHKPTQNRTQKLKMLLKSSDSSSHYEISSRGKTFRFSRQELIARSAYFETFFSSRFYEQAENQSRLEISDVTAGIIDVRHLHVMIKLMRATDVDGSGSSPRIEAQVTWHVGLFPLPHPAAGTKKIRNWLLAASDDGFVDILRMFDFFQLFELVKHCGICLKDNIKEADIRLALRLLPLADGSCGNHRLFAAALKLAAASYLEAIKILQEEKDTALKSDIIQRLIDERMGKSRVCGIFRVDTSLDDQENFNNSYVIVAFGPDATGSGEKWTPRIIEQFCLDNNERVTNAVTFHGYVYVLTTRFVPAKDVTQIRMRRFNPYMVVLKSIEKNEDGSEVKPVKTNKKAHSAFNLFHFKHKKPDQTVFGSGWLEEPCSLTKPGFVDHIHIETHLVDGEDHICLRFWSRPPSKRVGTGPRTILPLPLADADRFDIIKKKWTKCCECMETKKKFKGDFTNFLPKNVHFVPCFTTLKTLKQEFPASSGCY